MTWFVFEADVTFYEMLKQFCAIRSWTVLGPSTSLILFVITHVGSPGGVSVA